MTPTDAAWPSSPGEGEWPDHDGDGEPRVAAFMLGPEAGSYAYPPLDLLSIRRVRDLKLGLRVVLGVDGVLESCDEFHGATPESSIETRAVGCQADTPPFRCSDDDLRFLNENLPVWTVRAGQLEARRVSPEADCEEARSEFARDAP